MALILTMHNNKVLQFFNLKIDFTILNLFYWSLYLNRKFCFGGHLRWGFSNISCPLNHRNYDLREINVNRSELMFLLFRETIICTSLGTLSLRTLSLRTLTLSLKTFKVQQNILFSWADNKEHAIPSLINIPLNCYSMCLLR